MNVTETSTDGLKREFTIVVPAGEVEEQITKRLNDIGRAVRIPGFRPGKVPMPLLRKRYGPAVRGEVLESAVQDSSAEAIREQNLRPALQPRVEIVSAAEGADLEYKMSLEVLPDMPEPDFAGLGLEKLVAEVPDEEVAKAVDRLAESQRKTEAVERAAEAADIVVGDIVGRVGEEEIPGSRGEGREIDLGAEGLLPGFADQLVGASVGETREVKITFPADYGNSDYAGKEGVFEVAVKEIKQRLPATVDDELAKAVGLETLDELRQEIRQRMQRDFEGVTRERMKRALLDKLAERYDFPVPPGMVEMEYQTILQQYEAEKQRGTFDAPSADEASSDGSDDGPMDAAAMIAPEESALEGASDRSPTTTQHEHAQPHHEGHGEGHRVLSQANADEAPLDGSALIAPEETALEGASDTEAPVVVDEDDEKQKAEFQRIAERRVRLGLLLAEVGRNANITVSQEELNQALAQEARKHPGYERQVIDYFRKNPDALNNLRAPIFEEKVVDFIVELAKPDERKVTPQELMAAGEPEADGAAAA
ncbi:MAG TPA: trigger factor [Stellaceae bacterium]|jgi:trigger factor|nr:trigger factor [Stellaceae bacterium]